MCVHLCIKIYRHIYIYIYICIYIVASQCCVMIFSAVHQSELMIYIYTYPLCFGFPFHLGHRREVSRLPVLYSRFSLVIYFIHSTSSVYMSIPISRFILALLPLLVQMCLASVSLFFCFANKFICSVSLDFIFMC